MTMLILLGAAGCAPALGGEARRWPQLGFPAETPRCQVTVNDFPVSTRTARPYLGHVKTDVASVVPLSPYVLRAGDNHVRSDCALQVGVFDQDRVDVLARVTPAVEARFAQPASTPAWRWTHAPRIADDDATRASLHAAYRALAADLAAVQGDEGRRAALQQRLEASTAEHLRAAALLGPPPRHLAHLLRLAARLGDRAPGSLRPTPLPALEACALRVFAGGSLARLVRNDEAIVRYAGGRHDARDGVGPTDVAFDVWFRRDAHGTWIVDGIEQSYDNPRSYYSFGE